MKGLLQLTASILIPLCLAGCVRTTPSMQTSTQSTNPSVQATVPTTAPTSPTEPTPPLVTGWVEQNDERYYYLSDGTPCAGWAEVDGITRWFFEDGRLCTGWLDWDGKRYYLDAEGSPTLGWLELEGARYYFLEDGTMAKGKVNLSPDETRYFNSAGKEVILVNPWNTVPQDYAVTLAYHGDWQVAEEALQPLEQMLADCREAGYNAVVVSAYRSHETQKYLFKNRIQRFVNQGYDREEAERLAAMRVARPGTSEHELGLALDITDKDYQKLTTQQKTMPAQQWLMENCWQYGFILRYPNEKSDVTGIIYEPWHYRYVGIELSTELHDTGLCLEEYLNLLTEA